MSPGSPPTLKASTVSFPRANSSNWLWAPRSRNNLVDRRSRGSSRSLQARKILWRGRERKKRKKKHKSKGDKREATWGAVAAGAPRISLKARGGRQLTRGVTRGKARSRISPRDKGLPDGERKYGGFGVVQLSRAIIIRSARETDSGEIHITKIVSTLWSWNYSEQSSSCSVANCTSWFSAVE